MTESDYIGTEEPTRSDDEALEHPVPLTPISPTGAGTALPVAIGDGPDPSLRDDDEADLDVPAGVHDADTH